MHFRKQLGAAALIATAALAGCSGRDEGGNNNNEDAGCTGVCSTDAGNECPAAVNGLGPIGQLRANGTRGQAVKLDGLIITDVTNTYKGAQGDWIAQFWVVHPCFPKEGMYVDKYFTDATKNYQPKVGDVVNIEGLFRHFRADGFDTNNRNRESYRPVIKSTFKLDVPNVTGNLVITPTGETKALADHEAPAGFGDAKGGSVQANPEFGGARVHIPGPVSITNATPAALKARPDDPAHTQYNGFEVSGGILVNNHKTFAECDYRDVVVDGGTVTFTNGLRGTWDTYTHVACADGGVQTGSDGGTYCATYADGQVPGTEQPYTYVLYPQNCTTDLKQ